MRVEDLLAHVLKVIRISTTIAFQNFILVHEQMTEICISIYK